MIRVDLEKQFELQFKDKTPEEMIEIGKDIALKFIPKDKKTICCQIKYIKDFFTSPQRNNKNNKIP